jgi:hypothetical protein
MVPPRDDVWVVTAVEERDLGWVISWLNMRAGQGSTAIQDTYAGGGPFLIDRQTGRVAVCGSAHPVEYSANCLASVTSKSCDIWGTVTPSSSPSDAHRSAAGH